MTRNGHASMMSSHADLVRLFSDPFYRNLWEETPTDYRKSFLSVIDQIIEEVDAE